jgi:hypothetical protein
MEIQRVSRDRAAKQNMQTKNLNRTEDELYDDAIEAYKGRCEDEGWVFQIPSQYSSDVQGDRLILRNSNGVLALFDIIGDSLEWVEPTPSRVRYYEANY